MKKLLKKKLLWFGVIALLTLAVFMLPQLSVDKYALRFVSRVQASGIGGIILFFSALALAIVLLLPTAILTLGAGFVFGLVPGSILVVLATTLGAVIAFLLSRYVLRDRLNEKIQSDSQLGLIFRSRSVSRWEFVALVRMIPLFPSKLANYAFGLTPVGLTEYAIGTFIGLWPIAIFTVYVGSLASDLLSLQSEFSIPLPGNLIFSSLVLLTLFVLLLLLARRARRVLAEAGSDTYARPESLENEDTGR